MAANMVSFKGMLIIRFALEFKLEVRVVQFSNSSNPCESLKHLDVTVSVKSLIHPNPDLIVIVLQLPDVTVVSSLIYLVIEPDVIVIEPDVTVMIVTSKPPNVFL